MNADTRDTTERVYRAFEAGDGAALLELMHPRFVGVVTEGLPSGWGGVHRGPERMFADCWAPVFAVLETRPVPEEIVEAVDGRVIVTGRYLGRARGTGRRHEAAFVHLLTLADDGRVIGLVQVTDSARWHEALA